MLPLLQAAGYYWSHRREARGKAESWVGYYGVAGGGGTIIVEYETDVYLYFCFKQFTEIKRLQHSKFKK